MDIYQRKFQILFKHMKKIEKRRPPLGEYIQIISMLGKELLEAQRCIIWLYDEDRGKIIPQLSQDIAYCEIKAFDGIIGHVIRSGQNRIVNDNTQDPYYNPHLAEIMGFASYSSLFVPLKHSNNAVYGAIQAINKENGQLFTEEDLDYLIFVGLYCEEALTSYFFEEELIQTQNDIVFLLAELGESRSKETAMHVRRVSAMTEHLARLYGMHPRDVHMIKLASPLHDLGKVGIKDAVLNKPGPFTEEEFAHMQRHTYIGHNILAPMQRKLLRTADNICHQHHERFDGTGYPQGLKGEEIDIFARITSICDVFDALANDRVYKKAWPREDIIAEFSKQKGRQFAPDLTDLFLENLEDFYSILRQYPDE